MVHDPGPRAALDRAQAVESAAASPIPLAAGGTVLVGTSSWTDRTMTAHGVFYPRGVSSAEQRLAYYASTFPVVEIDATYYALPSAPVAEAWFARTPPGFTFDAKANALMTGQPSETERLPPDIRSMLPAELRSKPRLYAKDLPPELRDHVWKTFIAGLEPLWANGKLGSIILQYPRWFLPGSESRDAILEAKERLAPLRCAVELRNAAWFDARGLDRTMRLLADNAIPFVMTDGPQGLPSSVPPLALVTSPDLAVVRFHGRRAETWEAKGIPVVERFRYLYSREELADWLPKIHTVAKSARQVHLLMNNCYANYGSTNAREMAAMLKAEVGGR